ncbi:Ig-like domain repeat protein [Methanobrevibacter sp.]
MKKSNIVFVSILLIFLISMTASFASENIDNLQTQDDTDEALALPDSADELAVSDTESQTENKLTSNNDNSEDVLSDTPGTFQELNDLIVTSGSYVELKKNYTRLETGDLSSIILDKEVTIEGNGNYINGSYLSRIFDLRSDNIKFYNINFVEASLEDGSFIYGVNVNNIVVENCTFTNDLNYLHRNNDENIGHDGEELQTEQISDEEFWEMCANEIKGNGIYMRGEYLSIINSNFTYLFAGCGGAVYFEGNHLSINRSNFSVTRAFSGGALWLNGTDMTISNSYFIESKTEMSGGSMTIIGSDFSIIGSTFNSNYAGGELISQGNVVNLPSVPNFINTYGAGGGTINSHADNVNIINSNFINSLTRSSSFGGVIYSNGSINVVSSNFTNFSSAHGAGIFLDTGAINSQIDNCNFKSGYYTDCGGAVLSYADDTTIMKSTFESINVVSETSSYNIASAVAFTGNNAKLLYSNFTSNAANLESQVSCVAWISNIYNERLQFEVDENHGFNGLMENCIFKDNNGTVAYIYASNTTVKNCYFENNLATSYILMNVGSDLSIIDSNFTKNYGLEGYMVLLVTNKASISGCLFDSNLGAMSGGIAIFTFGDMGLDSELVDGPVSVEKSTFTNNNAQVAGAIFAGGYNDVVSDSVFENNSAIIGGAIYFSEAQSKILNSNFTNNRALLGGAIVMGNSLDINLLDSVLPVEFGLKEDGYDNVISGSSFINNTAEFAPGVLWLDERGLLEHSTFDGNKIKEYDGIDYVNGLLSLFIKVGLINEENYELFLQEQLEFFKETINAVKTQLTSYILPNAGGAVYWLGNDGIVNDTTFKNNDAGSSITYNVSQIDYAFVFYYSEWYVEHSDLKGSDFQYYSDYLLEYYENDYYEYLQKNPFEENYYSIEEWIMLQINDYVPIYYYDDNFGLTYEYFYIDFFVQSMDWEDTPPAGWRAYPIYAYDTQDYSDGYIEKIPQDSKGEVRIFTINLPPIEKTRNSSGGAIFWQGQNGLVNNSQFRQNFAQEGGAIFWQGQNGLVDNSQFSENSAQEGGAIYVEKDVDIKSSQFIANKAISGGAIYWLSNAGSIDDVKFFNNTAQEGGAIYFLDGGTSILNSQFRYNKADTGSALYVNGNGANIKSTSFLDNQAKSASLTFTSNINCTNVTVNAIFKGNDNFINAIYTMAACNLEDVTYWTGAGETNSDLVAPSITSFEDGIEIVLQLYDSSFKPITNVSLTNVNGEARLSLNNVKNGRYFLYVRHDEDTYYTEISSSEIIQVEKMDSPFDLGKTYLDVQDIDFTENATIHIELPGDATGNVTFEVDGRNYTTQNLTNGSASAEIPDLEGGKHNLTVYYSGDENYLANSTTATFTVNPIASNIIISTDGGDYKQDIAVNVVVENNAKGKVIITIEDEFGHTFAINDTNELQTFINTLNAGEYNITAFYAGDNNYLPSTNYTTLKVNPIDLNPGVAASNVTVLENSTFTITVPDDFVGYVNITVGQISKVYPIAGSTQLTFVNLPAGDKTANVTLYGDKNYNNATVYPVSFKVTPEIPEVISQLSVNITDTTYPAASNAQVNVSNNLNGTATITVDGKIYITTVQNGSGSTILDNLSGGIKTAIVEFISTDNVELSTSAKFIIYKADSIVDMESDGVDLIATVNSGATGNVTFYVNDAEFNVNLTEGVARLSGKLTAGVNDVVVIYNGDVNYTSSKTHNKFTSLLKDSQVNVTAKETVYGSACEITVNVGENQTGFVTITVNNENYTKELDKGQAVFAITGLNVKTYDVAVKYLGDETFNVSDNSTTLNVIEADLPASVIAQNITVLDSSAFFITYPGDFKGKVKITVDGFVYDGDVASLIKMDKLTAGEKTADVVFYGDDNYKNTSFVTSFTVSNVTDSGNGSDGSGGNGTLNISTVNADNMTRGYNSAYDYQAAFLDKNGSALANVEVEFRVNGETYKVKTNDDGIAQLTASKLAVGKYNITSVNLATGEQVTASLEIVKRITENKDLTMDYTDGSVFKVKVFGDDGKIAPAGEIIDIAANGVHYVAKVDKNGYASLKITLLPKTYKITAEYKGFKTTNKLVIKQILKAVKKTTKVKKGKKFALKAKLVWSNGKGIKGKVIKFKFKGKTYKAKTNKKGIAKVTIKKKVAKKLKKGKKYKVKVTYSVKQKYGNGYQTINDNIKIYVKVK